MRCGRVKYGQSGLEGMWSPGVRAKRSRKRAADSPRKGWGQLIDVHSCVIVSEGNATCRANPYHCAAVCGWVPDVTACDELAQSVGRPMRLMRK